MGASGGGEGWPATRPEVAAACSRAREATGSAAGRPSGKLATGCEATPATMRALADAEHLGPSRCRAPGGLGVAAACSRAPTGVDGLASSLTGAPRHRMDAPRRMLAVV